ncbi:very short patch repair endonuclease [Geomonas limicola]|uniref:very short patch repair endonuclease n=1 Tax=Geomonas limicola TaxID=2740186 RepID=UPI001621438B|nr:very short patch repair endonuclease [Geomonas limicola]
MQAKGKNKSSSPPKPPLTRSEIMARVRSKNTSPEVLIRSALHRAGLRFRIHRKDLPGNPDIVFPSRRIALFVNGCFWHQHPGCKRATIPASSREYWEKKLLRNSERDAANHAVLQSDRWRVVVVWECEINSEIIDLLIEEIKSTSPMD